MGRISLLSVARDSALTALQYLQVENARGAAVICNDFLREPTSKITIENYGAFPVLQFAVAHSTPSIERAGFIAACAERGIEACFILAEAQNLGARLPSDRIFALTDHINLTGDNPLIGPHDAALGQRFPDMSEPFSLRLLEMVEANSVLRPYVYASCPEDRPFDSTQQELLALIGVDTVGRWIGPELLCARQRSMKVLAFVAPAGAHYQTARSKVSGGLYYSQFREVIARILMQLCP